MELNKEHYLETIKVFHEENVRLKVEVGRQQMINDAYTERFKQLSREIFRLKEEMEALSEDHKNLASKTI